MSTTEPPTEITRDAIFDGPNCPGFSLSYGARRDFTRRAARNEAATARILTIEGDVGYAQGYRTGCLLRFVRTGEPGEGPFVAVAVSTAVDTGDVEGTLRFDPDTTLVGRVNKGAFGFGHGL